MPHRTRHAQIPSWACSRGQRPKYHTLHQRGVLASRGVRHTPVTRILDILDDLAKHIVLPLQRLDLLLQLNNLCMASNAEMEKYVVACLA